MTLRTLIVFVLLLASSAARAHGQCGQDAVSVHDAIETLRRTGTDRLDVYDLADGRWTDRAFTCQAIGDGTTTRRDRSIVGDRPRGNADNAAHDPAHVLPTAWAATNDRTLPRPSLDDEFNSLSLHYRPTGDDIWGLIAPRTPNGRGGPKWFEGDTRMWWTNPFNPKTPIQGLYTVSNGQLHLGLMSTPPAHQSWIDSSAGIHTPFVATLLYSVKKQLYGYFEIRASVDAVPGLTFQACLETGDVAFPFEIDMILYTNRDGSQHVKFDIAINHGWPSMEVGDIDITQKHTYAIEWTGSKITWYIDGIKRWSQPSPGGNYDIYPALWYLLTGAAYGGSDTDPNRAQLPAYAHIDWVRNWSSNPYKDPVRAGGDRSRQQD